MLTKKAEPSIKCNADLLTSGAGLIELFQQGLVDEDKQAVAANSLWAVVEQVGNRIELLLAVDREICTLGYRLMDLTA